jgi:hypothetical protein
VEDARSTSPGGAGEVTIDYLLATGRYSMFNPTSKGDLTLDYPELRKIPSFDALRPKHMLFVWHYACRASRASELHDDKDRMRYAVMRVWGRTPPKEIAETFMVGKWKKEIDDAIHDIRGFEVWPRLMMKLMCTQLVERVKRMLDAPVGELQGWDQKLEYFKAGKEGVALLQSIMPYTEHGVFGLSEVSDDQEEEEGRVMEWLHSQNDKN